MRFLNPKTDFAFKRIFGSERSHDILLSFLNAILGLQAPYRIIDLTLLDPYLAPKIQGMKDTYLDVRARDEQGQSTVYGDCGGQPERPLRLTRITGKPIISGSPSNHTAYLIQSMKFQYHSLLPRQSRPFHAHP